MLPPTRTPVVRPRVPHMMPPTRTPAVRPRVPHIMLLLPSDAIVLGSQGVTCDVASLLVTPAGLKQSWVVKIDAASAYVEY